MLVRVRTGRFTFKLVARGRKWSAASVLPRLVCVGSAVHCFYASGAKVAAAPALASGQSALQAGALLHELSSVWKMVLPAGIAPTSRGYRPRALLLS